MIRGRGYRSYNPPQYVTGHIDDFPLVPETPIDIAPRPILPSRFDQMRSRETIENRGAARPRTGC